MWKAVKPLYGLCDAPQKWYETLIDFLKNHLQGVASEVDKGCYYWTGKGNKSTFKKKVVKNVEDLKKSKPPLMVNRDELEAAVYGVVTIHCLLYTSPSPRDQRGSRMPSSA